MPCLLSCQFRCQVLQAVFICPNVLAQEVGHSWCQELRLVVAVIGQLRCRTIAPLQDEVMHAHGHAQLRLILYIRILENYNITCSLNNGSIILLVQFLLDRLAEPMRGFLCTCIHKHTLTKSLRLVLSQELVQFVVYGTGALTMLVRSSPMLASVLGLTLIASVVTMGRFWGSCTIMATPASSDWPLLIHCEWKSQTHDWICEFSKFNNLMSYQPSQGLKSQQFMNQNRK